MEVELITYKDSEEDYYYSIELADLKTNISGVIRAVTERTKKPDHLSIILYDNTGPQEIYETDVKDDLTVKLQDGINQIVKKAGKYEG